jgi:deazaflavin-dependent oxidoreductase (nitroreductase family)
MPARNDALKEYREIKITVTGRNSGRAISVPVWFVLDDDNLYLLPVEGSDTQWYKNVRKNPSIRINARGLEVVKPPASPRKGRRLMLALIVGATAIYNSNADNE